jgi:hypothetical protein
MLEKEDVVLGSSCDDIDIGTSKKKVSGVRDLASTSPMDSKTCDGSPYTKMNGLYYQVLYAWHVIFTYVV